MKQLPKIVHILDDIALGGVTKNLELFEHQALTRQFDFLVEEVHPEWSIAKKFEGASTIVVHFSVSWKSLPFLYSLSAKNAESNLVLVDHSYSKEWEALHVPNPKRFRSMLKLAHSIFDQVICVSEAQAAWFKSATGLAEPKAQVIYPWSDTQGLEMLARPHFSSSDALRIGAYGRFVAGKGFDRLIEVMNQLGQQKTIKLCLGGFGPDEEKLRCLAADNPNISFYGKVEKVGDFLDQCDVVAIPSRFEAYGLVATEARLAARPMLVANVGGLIEQVGQAGLTVDFDDHDAMVRLLQTIRYQPLTKMSVAGRDACLMVTEERVGSWLELLNSLHTQNQKRRAA